ncbi:MAG: polysialyltransferase family glycosyltransferase [Balneolaceae bacterium]|nr:polysialyltransferase family glycosyltransferase [Balneolaceae bacterium]
MNYYLVESPLQFLNAREAKYRFCKDEKNVLIILRGASQKSMDQLKKLVDYSSWDTVYELPNTHKKVVLYKWQYDLESILKENYQKVNKVFIGEYRSLLMRNFVHKSNCEQSFLLDDGNVALFIHEKIITKEGLRHTLHPIRKALNWLFNFNDKDIWDINFFTFYNEWTRDSDVINDYSLLKSSLNTRIVDEGLVYFLGNNISEYGFIERKDYLSLLRKVIECFEGKTVYYLPHRREEPEGFQEIEDLGFQIKTIDEPIETYLVKQNKLPEIIASFLSTALDNCYALFSDHSVLYSFQYDLDILKSDRYKKTAKIIFNRYKKYEGFKTIEI